VGSYRGSTLSVDRGAWLGNSEMAQRLLAFDWAGTPLGPIDGWPASLRSIVGVCLRSPFQMAIYWGPDLNCIYNDAECDVLGNLHPGALGLPARELLKDSWQITGRQLRRVMEEGETTWCEDQPLMVDRHGGAEVSYFTYAYSPIPDDDGTVGGVLLVTQDTTSRVLAERRLRTLRSLAGASMDATDECVACEAAAAALVGGPDVTFALVYVLDELGSAARCVAAASQGRCVPLHPTIDFDRDDRDSSLFRALADRSLDGQLVDSTRLVESGEHAQLPPLCFVTSVARGASDPVSGFLVAGVGREQRFDDSYSDFLRLAASGIGRSVAAARARGFERERAAARGREEERAKREAELRKLISDLRAARRRLVAAGSAERQRIERDLHDGAQQRLTVIRLELTLLAEMVEASDTRAAAKLAGIREQLDAALAELRELAHGLYPPLLASDGLSVALCEAARRASIGVTVDADGSGRAPRSIETAAYFCCLEAMQNAAKHGGEEVHATIRLRMSGGMLDFGVTDDGAGFDTASVRPGYGLINMRDRVDALGGLIDVISAPGKGTTVHGRIPLP